jgi:NAD+ synthase
MIKDLAKTEKHIVNWIKEYAESAGIQTLVVGLSGGIDSALTALLCKKTGIPTVCVAMPCHSSDFSLKRAKRFAVEQGLKLITIYLDHSYDSVMAQVNALDVSRKTEIDEMSLNGKYATGGFRSCLRAPVLSYFALASKGLVVGTGNRSEDNLIRYFQKYGDGCVDISPIADLFKSEVYELFAHMTGLTNALRDNGINFAEGPSASSAIYVATPTADLWGENGGQTDEEELGITYDEVEWADRQNEITKLQHQKPIVTDEGDPAKHPAWLGYTGWQREVIAKVHQMEKISRHKYNPALPVCPIRDRGFVD